MKQTCVGVLIAAWLVLAAGCSEIGSPSSAGSGQVDGEAGAANASEPNPRGRDEGGDRKIEPATPDAAPPAAEATAPVAEKTAPQAPQSDSAAAAPVAKPPEADATEGAKPDKPATAQGDGHLAPQQVATGGDGRARNVTFDNIKFPMDDPKSRMFKRDMLTESIEKLSGTRIRIRGFILPGALEEFSNFVLVRDNQECCFGPGSAIYDSIMVDVKQDGASGAGTVKFTTRPITVEGTFEIKELIGPDKKHWSIYRLTATKVE